MTMGRCLSLGVSPFCTSAFEHPAGIARRYNPRWNGGSHDAASADHSMAPDHHAGQDYAVRSDPDVFAHHNLVGSGAIPLFTNGSAQVVKGVIGGMKLRSGPNKRIAADGQRGSSRDADE